jgi:3-hydroxyisobutyrate dehydrogenase-like beta-hydroxyacid dehydrogenase
MDVAIAGLGQMGKPIAANLLRSGARLIAFAPSDRAFKDLVAMGAEATQDAARLAKAEFIFICLPDVGVVSDLLFGDRGIAELLQPGQTVIDLGTSDFRTTIKLSERLATQQVDMLDAPVSGMAPRAIDGTLTIMCGGERPTFDRVRPLLSWIGKTILFMGPAGCGQLTKLINQLLLNINLAALAEILPMAAKLGLDPSRVAEVVNTGTGRSYASEYFVPRILKGHFRDGYPMQAAYKDLICAATVSADQGIPLPVLAAATATYQQALRKGHGEKDKGGMILVFEELLEVAFREVDKGSAV